MNYSTTYTAGTSNIPDGTYLIGGDISGYETASYSAVSNYCDSSNWVSFRKRKLNILQLILKIK